MNSANHFISVGCPKNQEYIFLGCLGNHAEVHPLSGVFGMTQSSFATRLQSNTPTDHISQIEIQHNYRD
jgi:hypothetical protein